MCFSVRYFLLASSSAVKADTLVGNQLQVNLQSWLSPPDPSVNHNNACKTQHEGTATWFIQGRKFREWKENGSLLWIRGNRAPLPPVLPSRTLNPSPVPQLVRVKASSGTQSSCLFAI